MACSPLGGRGSWPGPWGLASHTPAPAAPATALKMNMNLRELYLADNKLNGLQDSAQLGNLLKFNCSLQILDLRNNHVLDSGVHETHPPFQAPSTHRLLHGVHGILSQKTPTGQGWTAGPQSGHLLSLPSLGVRVSWRRGRLIGDLQDEARC